MKNAPLYRRILSVVLTVAMLFSLLVPAVSAENGKAASQVEELELVPVDPGTLESLKVKFASEDTTVNQEDHKLTDVVRVSIVLDKASTLEAGFQAEGIAKNAAAKSYRENLRTEQAAMTAKIEKAIGGKLDVQWNLTLAANIISANVLYGQIDTIKALDGIRAVFLENRYEPQKAEKGDEPNNGSASVMIGSNISWAAGYTGAGSKVAVIDTGIDSEHQSFSGEGLEYALAKNAEEKGMSYEEYIATLNLLTPESIDAVKDQLNADIGSGAAAYRSTKIGYGYNYVDKTVSYIEHNNDSQGEHGSHVEGISAANRFIKVDGEFKPALEAVGTQGVAPDAQIVTMKVFGKGGGAYDSDYMVAIEDAIILGCDSANLSLGSGSAGFSFSGGYENVLNELVQNGMVCSISAGNAYGWYDTPKNLAYPYIYADDSHYDTIGSPGSFTNSLCVASVDNTGKTGTPLLFGDLHVFYNETSGYGNAPFVTLSGKDYEYVLIDSPGVDDNDHVGGEGDDFLALGSEVLTGKVAMCFRGSSSFFAKANAAVAQGAAAVIIINNTSGAINMNLTGYNYTAPAVSIMQADGLAIMANSEAVTTESGMTYYTGTMSMGEGLEVFSPGPTDQVTVSSFSSWGAPGTLVMKPELLAPGGSIYSVWGANIGQDSPTDSHESYELMSGTSMAAPQVNGMAGVLGQYIRDNNLCEKTGLTQRQLINSLLMSTAHPVYDADGNYYPVLRVGAGLANVGDAVSAKSYILMDEDSTLFSDTAKDGKVKVELGDDPERTGEYTYSFTVYPLEGKKEFALRTDIFAQWLAGNGGYGMLQDQATTLIGSEATYEIDGQTYEDAFLVDADVNMDGKTDEADARAILDHLTGAEAEGAKFDEDAADVDGDGKITSYDAKLILESAATPIIEVSEPTHVTVHLKLDEGDKNFLLRYFTNGFYVQGYTYVEPVADEEGAMDVVHSIPILGFCGSWTDPSVFDRTSAIDDAYGTGKLTYVAPTNTINYLSLKDADGNTAIYMGNPFTVEDSFPADKLAMNSDATIAAYNYLNIRNVATLGFAVQDEQGKVLFAQATAANKYGAYYYVNGGSWQNYNPANYNVGKKLSAAGVKEGDKVTVGFYALPEYYAIANAKLNGEDAASGSLDTEGFKNVLEAGLIGDGAAIKYTVTVDNTAPEVLGAFRDLITGDITVKAKDNAYIAYVGITNKSGSEEYFSTVPDNTPGEEVEIPLELEGIDLPKECVLLVGDYAGNKTAFKVNLGGDGGEEESNAGLMIGFVSDVTAVGPGSGNRAWAIDPATVNVTSATTYAGVELYANTEFTVSAAEYVDGYVFMAANDGWFYASELEAMNEAALVGKFSDTVEKIYDMAFNYKDNLMYVLGNDNTIYTMDLYSGELTPVYAVTLPGVSGSNAEINRMAIDDDGVIYLANYGYSSSTKLFKYVPEYAEEVPDAPVDELPEGAIYGWTFEDTTNGLAGWTLVDADGDGANFALSTGNAHTGSGHISSKWHTPAPDNWAITPAIDLTNATSAQASLWAKSRSTGSFQEYFEVYVGETNVPEEMTKVIEKTMAPLGTYTEYTVNLSEYLGKTVYVGIRHLDSLDMYYLDVDDVIVYGEIPEEPEEPIDEPVIEAEPVEAELIGTMGVSYNYSYAGSMAFDHEKDVLYIASNWSERDDYDAVLWTVNTETGAATKANSAGAILRGSVRGLFIVPGREPVVKPVEEATGLIVEPEELNLLVGQSDEIKVAVQPWILENQDVTFESADQAIATVKDGVVTGVAVGTTTITVTTDAEPHLTAEVAVNVVEAPVAELRGIIWDENGKGQASVFKTNATNDWEAISVVGQFRWGALVGDVVYGSTDDTMYAFDADTYEVETFGGIVSMWIPSDACELPQDFRDAFAAMGYAVGPVIGPNNNGTYLTMLDPESGSLIYFDLSDSLFGSDPMATFTYAYRGVYNDGESIDNDGAVFYCMTESGALYTFTMNHEGSVMWELIGETGIDLTGVADATNQVWASMVYDEENEFLYLSRYNGEDEFAHLFAIDANEPARNGEVGNFNADVWPVTGLYEYEPATDLSLKVTPTDVVLFEGDTAEVKIKVKLGETNEYTFEVADENICTFEDGVITGVKEGETTITITTVDTNEAGEHLSETINVKVKGLKSVEAFVTGQVTDAHGARFASISLDGAIASKKGPEAPGNISSGGRGGDIYFGAIGTNPFALSAEDFTTPVSYEFDDYYSQYPAMDMANYPVFTNADGELDESRIVFTTSLGWLVKPDYYGWNLSSYIPKMAGVCFAGTTELDDGTELYIYYILDTDGILYQLGIDFVGGRRTEPQAILETGIVLADQGDASMAFITTVNYHGDSELDIGEQGIVVADNGSKKLWFIDFTAEDADDVVGLIGVMDAENISGLIGSFDDMASADGSDVPEPEPEVPYNAVVTFDFEANPLNTGWAFVDKDNDGYNWSWNLADTSSNYNVYEGSGIIVSESYHNNDDGETGVALFPDNWAISPAIDLSEVGEDAILSLYARGQDPDWASEKFAIYAGTTADPDQMTKIGGDFTVTGAYKQYTASLAAFAGESEVYVAIRHYNVTDMFVLNVDYVQVMEPEEVNPEAVSYEAVQPAFLKGNLGDGTARLDRAIDESVEMSKIGETANAVVGGTNALKAESFTELKRVLADETTARAGEATIVLTDDEPVTNGLYEISYNPEVLTYVETVSDLEYFSVNEKDGVIKVAFASLEEIAPETVLATLKFTFDAHANVDTVVTVNVLERNDDVAVEGETLEIPIKGHDCPCAMFKDMPPYGTIEHAAIDWAYTHEPFITDGIADDEFGVNMTVTRGQAVTFLYRASGNPAVSGTTPFTDLTQDWYKDPVLWAYTADPQITDGMTDTTFEPDTTLNRAMLLTFLYRQQGKPEYEASDAFADVPEWYRDAMIWALQNGIIDENTKWDEDCPRVDVVVYLFRVYEPEAAAAFDGE